MTWEFLALELIKASIVRPVILVLAVFAFLLIFRVRHPASKHAVWTATLIAILLLPIISVWIPHLNLPVLPERKPVDVAQRHILANPPSSGPGTIPVTPQARSNSSPSLPASVQSKTVDVETIVVWIYLAGLAVMVAYRIEGSIMLRRVLLRSGPKTRGWLRESVDVVVPVTSGIIRPVVLLPEGWREWNPGQRRAVLAHEFEHIRRRDTLISGFGRLATSLLWFHPLMWWLARKLSELSEMACDISAVRTAENPGAYAQILLDFAAIVRRAGHRSALPGIAIAGSGLGRRVEMVLAVPDTPIRHGTRPGYVLGLIGVPILLMAATLGITAMPGQLRLETTPPPSPPRAPWSGATPTQIESEIPKDMGRITGHLLTADGRPAPNTEVMAVQGPENRNGAEIWTIVRRGRTDNAGRYRMDLPAGRYSIGYQGTVTTYYPGVSDSKRAGRILVTEGKSTRGLDFRLDRSSGVRLRGRLLPAPGPASWLVQVGLGSPVTDFATPFGYDLYSSAIGLFPVNPDGSFEFSVVPQGQYALRVFAVSTTHPQPISLPGQPDVPFGNGGSRHYNQPPGYNVVVPQRDLNEVHVRVPLFVAAYIGLENGKSLPDVIADSVKIRTDGNYSILSELPSGIKLIAAGPGQHRIAFELPFGYYMKTLTYGTTDLLRAPLKLSGPPTSEIIGKVTTTPPVEAANFVTVRGHVTGLPDKLSNTYLRASGSLIAVLVASGSGGFGYSPVRDDGNFEFRGVPPGTHTGYATVSGSKYEFGKSIVVAGANLSGVELPVDPNLIRDRR